MRGAGHGEVLPPRFLHEPRQGQHPLTEHRGEVLAPEESQAIVQITMICVRLRESWPRLASI